MTLDEAIKHAKEVASEKRYEYQECVAVHDIESAEECGRCGEQHEQLAEWLKDYKRLLEQQSKIWDLDDAREDFIYNVYNILDCLPTNNEANRIIDSFDRVTSSIRQEPCDDAVSRKDAEQMFRNIRSHLKPQDYKSAEEFNTRDLMLLNAEQMIHALPSVTKKSGKWIVHPEIETSTPEYLMFYECSECGDKQCFCKSDIHKKRFCSNCGAKMQESEE